MVNWRFPLLLLVLVTLFFGGATKARAAPEGFRLPFVGEATITTLPGQGLHREGRRGFIGDNEAIDFSFGIKEIYASQAGRVVSAGWKDDYGNLIVIEHEGDLYTYYAHLSETVVEEGRKVSKGQFIGKSGNTGTTSGATGVHLHFSVRSGVNPKNFAYTGSPVKFIDHPDINLDNNKAVGPPLEESSPSPSPSQPEEWVLAKKEEFRLIVPWWWNFAVRSSIPFRLVLDDKVILESSNDADTGYLFIGWGTHKLQFFAKEKEKVQYAYARFPFKPIFPAYAAESLETTETLSNETTKETVLKEETNVPKGKILFTLDTFAPHPEKNDPQFVIMDLDGKNLQKLTTNFSESGMIGFVSLSPDLENVLFTYTSGFEFPPSEGDIHGIYTIDIKSGDVTTILSNDHPIIREYTTVYYQASRSVLVGPRYFPDGGKILFVCGTEYMISTDICVMDSNGENVKNLTNNDKGTYSIFASISPSGEVIVFIGPDMHIYTMDILGRNRKKISKTSMYPQDLVFSQDSSRVLWEASGNLYIVDIDGENEQIFKVNGDILWPLVFSPDNRRIVFWSTKDYKDYKESQGLEGDLYILDAETGNLQRLTNDPEYEFPLVFSHDGNRLLFISDRALFIIDVNDKTRNLLSTIPEEALPYRDLSFYIESYF